MMFKSIVLSILLFFSCSVDSTSDKKVKEGLLSNDSISLSKDSSANSKSNNSSEFVIRNESAIFYSPDSGEIEKLRLKLGEEDFDKVAEDIIFYNGEAIKMLESQKVHVEFTDKRFLKFINKDGYFDILDKNKLSEHWGIILFNSVSKPFITNSVSLDSVTIKTYFIKQ